MYDPGLCEKFERPVFLLTRQCRYPTLPDHDRVLFNARPHGPVATACKTIAPLRRIPFDTALSFYCNATAVASTPCRSDCAYAPDRDSQSALHCGNRSGSRAAPCHTRQSHPLRMQTSSTPAAVSYSRHRLWRWNRPRQRLSLDAWADG